MSLHLKPKCLMQAISPLLLVMACRSILVRRTTNLQRLINLRSNPLLRGILLLATHHRPHTRCSLFTIQAKPTSSPLISLRHNTLRHHRSLVRVLLYCLTILHRDGTNPMRLSRPFQLLSTALNLLVLILSHIRSRTTRMQRTRM